MERFEMTKEQALERLRGAYEELRSERAQKLERYEKLEDVWKKYLHGKLDLSATYINDVEDEMLTLKAKLISEENEWKLRHGIEVYENTLLDCFVPYTSYPGGIVEDPAIKFQKWLSPAPYANDLQSRPRKLGDVETINPNKKYL